MQSSSEKLDELEELDEDELDEDELEGDELLLDELELLEDVELEGRGGRFGFFGRSFRNSLSASHSPLSRATSSAKTPSHSRSSIRSPSRIMSRMMSGTTHQYFHHQPQTSCDVGS